MKIAFVIPWYGNIPGGAETECRRTAENLFKSGMEVEVLTTCVKEFMSNWNKDFYREGIYDVNGIKVRRFKSRQRNTRLFDKINIKLMHNQKISPQEEIQFITEMVNSDNLYKYINDNKSDYDYFIFLPYMFGTTYFGSKTCPEKSILIPCLHDESYAQMNIYRDMLEKASGVIFLSEPEFKLASRLFKLSSKKTAVLGAGIDTEIDYDSQRFRDKIGIDNEFILYAGRKDDGKNVPMLIDYFCRYKQKNPTDLKLVLIGNGKVKMPSKYKEEIIDLGFVSSQDKYDAYAASAILCQPSVNESFSIVIMEAWLCETPVLVHADCEVTKDHCIKSNGGLYFSGYEEFEGCIDYFIANSNKSKKMGLNGKKYVLENYNWGVITNKYKKIFQEWRDPAAN